MARGFSELQLFEIGAAFQSGMPGGQTNNAAGIIAGAGGRDWSKSGHPADLFDAKAALFGALESAMGGAMTAPVTAGGPAWFHPGRSGTIALGPKQIGWFGELHPRNLAAFDLKLPVAGFEINLDAIPESKAKGNARPLFSPSPYQAIERDFAFVVDRGVAAGDLVRAVKGAERNLIESVSVFDVYEGKGVPEGKKSIIAIAMAAAQRQNPHRSGNRIGGAEDRRRHAQTWRHLAELSMTGARGFDAKSALAFVIAFGFVSLFADAAYEGMRGVSGPFLATLGASGTVVGVIAGGGELVGYLLRLVSGRLAEKSGAYWPIAIGGYTIQMAAVPALALAGSWAGCRAVHRSGTHRQGDPQSVGQSDAVAGRQAYRPGLGFRAA